MKGEVDLIPELRAFIARKYKTQTAAAEAWGVSTALVSKVLRGLCAPNKRILEDAGLVAVPGEVRYKRKPKGKSEEAK